MLRDLYRYYTMGSGKLPYDQRIFIMYEIWQGVKLDFYKLFIYKWTFTSSVHLKDFKNN